MQGGGININGGTVNIDNSQISSNTATGGSCLPIQRPAGVALLGGVAFLRSFVPVWQEVRFWAGIQTHTYPGAHG